MKRTLKNLKEKWNCRTLREQLLILWILLGISFLLDELNCRFLTMQYNCRMEELLYVTDFYWLSPVFGIVDLIIGILIFKKTFISLDITIHRFVFNRPNYTTFEFSVPVITRGINTLLSKGLSLYVIAISICSLMTDVVKFLK